MAYAYTYLKGYFSALGIKVILDIMLSETSQTQEDKNGMFHLREVSQVFQFIEAKQSRLVIAGYLGEDKMGHFFFSRHQFSVLLMKKG